MKYLLMVHADPDRVDSLTDTELDALAHARAAFNKELADEGVLISAEGLADSVNAKSVRVRDGEPVVTNGPFAESGKPLASYYLVDCDDLDRALELAARVPDAKFDSVEVRPVMDIAGLEM